MPILSNFVRMAVCFSINHGAVVAVLSLANGLLGDNANYENASLYLTYAFTAMFFATGLIDVMGAKRSLWVAAALYSVYVISFPLALIIPKSQPGAEIAVALFGGIVGGFAAGFLWSAQGTYFGLSAKAYAAEKGIEVTEANGELASIFASIFLGLEVVLKLLPLVLIPLNGDISLWAHEPDATNITSNITNFSLAPSPPPPWPADKCKIYKCVATRDLITVSLYAVLAIGSVVGLLSITDLREEQGLVPFANEDALQTTLLKPKKKTFSLDKALAAVHLWWEDPVVLLLAPIQVTFGVCATMLAVNVTGNVVKAKFGSNDWIIFGALFSAMIAIVAAALQWPFKRIASKLGKMPLMLTMLIAFLIESLLIVTLSDKQLGAWGVLVPLYIMQGIGRAGYEGTNKALYADFFPNSLPAAFSNIVIANGLASAASFFLETPLKHDLVLHTGDSIGKAIPVAALVLTGLTIMSYSLAELFRWRRSAGRS
eukprot:CAMPEP_0174703596 /NCGR_PEP_ID=MMETSP1094-20130205/7485_1 /TAXON_ID=156173 /ORGANISM="Chrysochromulina brevifilum, Strain UTEX LB 985" /LENGTH=485 /DNA_ID=CAMNT_0015901541 /DNA_START=74 /DNA_END=1531 /DNA_ORIENTATION=-